jgi:hypothetical protein
VEFSLAWPSISKSFGAANFRIRTEIADEDYLVDATCHDALRVAICSPLPDRVPGTRPLE